MSEQPNNGNDDNTGTTDAGSSTDAQAAAELGTTEGEVRQAVRESGAVHQAGSEGTRPVWEASPDGKEFLDKEDERQEQIAKENDEAEKQREEAEAEVGDDESILDHKLSELGDENKDNSDEE